MSGQISTTSIRAIFRRGFNMSTPSWKCARSLASWIISPSSMSTSASSGLLSIFRYNLSTVSVQLYQLFPWTPSDMHRHAFVLPQPQVVFGGDPEAALIQYTKNEEARRAISSTEAVLNNRFIRVYWHRETGTNNTGVQQQEQTPGNQAAGAAPGQGTQHGAVHKVGTKSCNVWSLSIYCIYLCTSTIWLNFFFCRE